MSAKVAVFYVTFKVTDDDYRGVKTVKAGTMTLTAPATPAGIVVKFVVEVPEALLEPIEVAVTLDARDGVVQALQKTAKDLS